MSSKEKAKWEVTLKNILYYVDDSKEQERMIDILKKYKDMLPDNKLKDWIENRILNAKTDYYAKVDHIVNDILSGKMDNEKKKVLSAMLCELQPIVEKAERSFWNKLCDIFKWS